MPRSANELRDLARVCRDLDCERGDESPPPLPLLLPLLLVRSPAAPSAVVHPKTLAMATPRAAATLAELCPGTSCLLKRGGESAPMDSTQLSLNEPTGIPLWASETRSS